MLNVLLPMAGNSPLAEELGYPYPSSLVEIGGLPLIQRVIQNLNALDDKITLIAVLRAEDCRRFHLDSTIKLLAGNSAHFVTVQKETAGALCSILLAIEFIYNDDPLIVANTDQVFDNGVLRSFMQQVESLEPDAACPTFDSVHPRWSFLRINDGRVVEALEKNPMSRQAVAGLYYFKSGKAFADAAMRAVLNGRDTDGRFFVSAVLNEYILDEKSVVSIPIECSSFHSFFTAQRVVEYEQRARALNG